MQALSDNAELAKRNTRLIEESEALLMRCQANGDAQAPASPAAKKSKRGLFPFRKYATGFLPGWALLALIGIVIRDCITHIIPLVVWHRGSPSVGYSTQCLWTQDPSCVGTACCIASRHLWASPMLSVLLCRSASRTMLPSHLADGDGAGSQDSPHSQASSCSSFPGRGAPADAEGLQLECAHLRQENSRLLAENRQLGEQ